MVYINYNPAASTKLNPQNRISYSPPEQESAQLGSWRLWPFMTHILTWLYPNHTDAAQLGGFPFRRDLYFIRFLLFKLMQMFYERQGLFASGFNTTPFRAFLIGYILDVWVLNPHTIHTYQNQHTSSFRARLLISTQKINYCCINR